MRHTNVNRWSIFLFLALFGLAAAPATRAQDRPGREGRDVDPAQRVERTLSRLDRQLELTAEQETRIRQILTERQQPFRAPDGEQSAEQRQARREQYRAHAAETAKQIESVLTPQQAEKYRALQQAGRQRGARSRDDRRPGEARRGERRQGADAQQQVGRMVERLDRSLDLTDAQEAQIAQILESRAREARAVTAQDRAARREALRARHAETHAAILSVLTPEQAEKLKTRQARMGDRAKQRSGRRARG